MAAVNARAAVALLAEVLGTHVELIGSLAGGENGATEVRIGDDGRRVIKWELDEGRQRRRREGAQLAERLRVEAEWPSPVQETIEVDDCLFVVQEFMSGTTVEHLSHDLVETLFALHERRLSLAEGADPHGWAENMIELLVEGGRGYCLHQPLRDFDDRSRRVVERIEEIGRSLRSGDLMGVDIVHGDLHPGNLLQVNGQLSAIVDMDYTTVGDGSFDLTMLAISSLGVTVEPGVRSRLFDRGVHTLPEPKRHAYVANLFLRNLDWPIRKQRPAEIEFWLKQADRLLPPS